MNPADGEHRDVPEPSDEDPTDESDDILTDEELKHLGHIEAADAAGTSYIPDVRGRKALGTMRSEGGTELSDEDHRRIYEEITGEPLNRPDPNEPEELPPAASADAS